MKKIDRLKAEATATAEANGHTLKSFLKGSYFGDKCATVCATCERGVMVDATSSGDGITGEATLLPCHRDVSRLRTSCSSCGNEMEGKRTCPLCGKPEGGT